MSYRNDLDALAARHDALEAEVATATRERDAASVLLEEARQRAKLPILDNIRVATPCSADWNAMTGDDRVRACGSCKKHVYNLSSMTRDEAQALLIEREGKLCVRYFQRADGTIMLADCTIGKAQQRKRRVFAAGAAAMLAGGGALAFDLTRTDDAHQRATTGEAHFVTTGKPQMGDPSFEPHGGYVMGGSATSAPEPLREVKGDLKVEPPILLTPPVQPHHTGRKPR